MTARIFALFLSLLTLANLAGDFLWPGFDGNTWWISFGSLPESIAVPVLLIFAVSMLAFAFRAPRAGRRSAFVAAVAILLAMIALVNSVSFYRLMAGGRIDARCPVPLSLVVCAGMILVARAAWVPRDSVRVRPVWIGAGALSMLAVFPLALMLFFGNTDYRRPADAVVVFGARAYADGRLSDALRDRIRTACELYRTGLARRLVLSGGQGDGAITEAETMRRYALNHGVRAEDIFIDDQGVNTEATVRNTAPLFRQWHAQRVLAVSHFYHLPRIKLAYERAGVAVCTVPARQGHLLGQMPFNMAREVAAFWMYYVKQKPVAGSA